MPSRASLSASALPVGVRSDDGLGSHDDTLADFVLTPPDLACHGDEPIDLRQSYETTRGAGWVTCDQTGQEHFTLHSGFGYLVRLQ
jgi:hypothetical protein